MKLVRIVPHGSLAKHGSMAISASTAAEAIEGWSRQCDFGHIRPVIEVDGFDTDEQLLLPIETEELHIFPAMVGGGGNLVKMVIGTVLIVVGVLLIPTNPALAGALIGAGIGMFISGVMGLFMPSPKMDKPEDQPNSKYIGAGRNTTAIGTLIPMGGGRMLVGGQFLSVQVNEADMLLGKFPATP